MNHTSAFLTGAGGRQIFWRTWTPDAAPTAVVVLAHGAGGERIGSADRTVRAYDGLFHEILNEPERETVLDDICGWLSARAAAPDRDPAGSSRS